MKEIYATNLKATIDGIEYLWYGVFGEVLRSYESGIKQGDVRMIGNVIFYAYRVSCYSLFPWKKSISWSPQEKIDFNWIKNFQIAIFK